MCLQASKTLGYKVSAHLTPYWSRYKPSKRELWFSLNPKGPVHPLQPTLTPTRTLNMNPYKNPEFEFDGYEKEVGQVTPTKNPNTYLEPLT